MLDAPLERLVVCFAHDDVDVPGVVVDQCLAQRRAIGGPATVGLPFLYGQEYRVCPSLRAPALPLQPPCVVFPAPHRRLNLFGIVACLQLRLEERATNPLRPVEPACPCTTNTVPFGTSRAGRADDLEGCSEGSPEEAELPSIVDAIEAYEEKRWPLGKVAGGKASPSGVQSIFAQQEAGHAGPFLPRFAQSQRSVRAGVGDLSGPRRARRAPERRWRARNRSDELGLRAASERSRTKARHQRA